MTPHTNSSSPATPSTNSQRHRDEYYMNLAIEQAQKSLEQGGIPIGSVMVFESPDTENTTNDTTTDGSNSNDRTENVTHGGKLLSAGHNQRIQKSSAILHAEMDCLEKAGRLSNKQYSNCTLYSTLSPCDMCSGTILLYKIPRVVIGEKETFEGPTEYLRQRGVEIVNLDSDKCKEMMRKFIKEKPELWNEDIGV